MRLLLWLAAAGVAVNTGILLPSGGSDSASSIRFIDATPSTHINFRHQSSATPRKYLPESMSGGVAAFDFDGDGWLDVFFVNGAKLQDPMTAGMTPDKSSPAFWNRLYRNNHDGTFTDVTERARLNGVGYGMGAVAADFDNDGDEDLYVTALGGNKLYRNNGDGTFTDVTTEAGVGGSGWSSGALFVDYDRDGLLDLVVARYLAWSFDRDIWCGEHKPGYRAYCHPDQFAPISHLVFHNEGGGHFRDVSKASQVAQFPGKGLGIAMNDYDHDGWPDIFVANDAVPQQLFHNRHDGTFEECGTMSGVAYDSDGRSFSGMGTDFADYDNDGWADLFANALATQRYGLFHNEKGTFEYVSELSGVGRASILHSGWGAKFEDFDNDGWKDLFVGQSHVMDNISLTLPQAHYLESPLLMKNVMGKFRDVSAQAGVAMQVKTVARGVAFGDFNNDGRVDAVINNNNGKATMLQNESAAQHWLSIITMGRESNRDGIGTQLRLSTETGPTQYAEVSTAASYLSSNDRRVHFGLGTNALVKSIEIDWPSGKKQRLTDVGADRIVKIMEP